MLSTLLSDVFQSIRFAPSLSVFSVAAQRIPNIDNRKYPGCQRDLCTFQSLCVACTIPFFMVAVGDMDIQGAVQIGNGMQHIISKLWILPHDHPFIIRQCLKLTRMRSGIPNFPISEDLLNAAGGWSTYRQSCSRKFPHRVCSRRLPNASRTSGGYRLPSARPTPCHPRQGLSGRT